MRSVWRAAVRAASGVVLLLALLAAPASLAQSPDPSRARLTVAQPRVQLSLNPGAAGEGELRFTYDGPAPTAGQLAVLEYHIGPDGPSARPAADPNAGGAARWISLTPSSLSLRLATPEVVRYRVQVPPDTPPGDHSALIRLETESPALTAGVRLTVNVPGPARQQASLLAFGGLREAPYGPSFQLPGGLPLYHGGPIQFRAQVQNGGNVQFTSSGKIVVSDPLGNQAASLELPTDQIFPGDVGTSIVQWTEPPAVGLFTARLSLDAGGSPISAEQRLLILPWQQILAALLFALALRLLLGRHLTLPLPGRRPAGVTADAPPAALAPAPQAPPANGADRVATLAAAWRAREAGPADKAAVEPPPERTDPAPAPQPAAVSPDNPLVAAELLRWGQQAARAGDRLVAYRLFVRAVEIDPSSEEAWLWRAGTAAEPDEAIRCLNRVLEINPDNARARRGLDEMQRRFADGGV
jgi:hypothetical protein